MPESRSGDVLPRAMICGWCGGARVIRLMGGRRIVCPECHGKNSVVVDALTPREVKVLLLRGKAEGGFE